MSNVQQGMSNVQIDLALGHQCSLSVLNGNKSQAQRFLGHWTFLVGNWTFPWTFPEISTFATHSKKFSNHFTRHSPEGLGRRRG